MSLKPDSLLHRVYRTHRTLHPFLAEIGRDLAELLQCGFKVPGNVRRDESLPLLQCCDIY